MHLILNVDLFLASSASKLGWDYLLIKIQILEHDGLPCVLSYGVVSSLSSHTACIFFFSFLAHCDSGNIPYLWN